MDPKTQKGAYPEDLQKGHSQLTLQALTLTTHTAGNARRNNRHHDRPSTNSYDSESLPKESGGVPYQPEQQELQKAEAKLLYKAVTGETPTTEYYKAAETEKHLDHNSGQAKDDSRRTSGQHNAEANPRYTPTETKKLTEHRSSHVRPESHDTSTNIPDLHEVRKEQPGVTPRDTKQSSKNECLTTGAATSDLHKVEGPQTEPPYTSGTPRSQGTTYSSATTDGTKERVTKTAVGCLHKAPRENPQSGNH
ncbi:hypothetical protein Taro_037868 [Colocasia esculenta]|uniref:Uncharacterized protein n=1 Tax=Colocasia esculenta TaxID=4460 RepID=A0A843W585_COLES|nr:hypothetical protein [Colocasia esculenta]